MKNKLDIFRRISLACLIICILTSMAGCKLAKQDGSVAGSVDRLIGCYITTEYIGEEKIYAELVEKIEDGIKFMEYEFRNNAGIACYIPTIYAKDSGSNDYVSGTYGEGLSSVSTVLNSRGNDGKVNELIGTIYITETSTYYMNNVYQEQDGDVYMVSAIMGTHVTIRGGYTSSIEETCTVTKDGETIDEKTKVEITFDYMPSPKSINFVYMDSDNNVVETKQYQPGAVPMEVSVAENAEYIIVETYAYDKTEEKEVVTRQIADRNDEDVMTYVDTGKGVCEQKMIILNW